MSQTQSILAQPPTFSPANPNDSDTYGEDCTAAMTARGTTITSVGTPTIVVTPANATPIVISNVSVLTGGLKYAWHGAGGSADSMNIITFPLTLADGNVINRTVRIPIQNNIG